MLRIASLVALIFPLVVYLFTLARQITFTDSGELAAAAATLGIAHPPGYPFFLLLGHLVSLVPVGSVAFRIGLVSASANALTSLLIFRLGYELSPQVKGSGRIWAPLTGALLYAFALTPWSQAVVVEVYALQALLVTACLAVCVYALDGSRNPISFWPLAGFCMGLALTNHSTSVLLLPSLLIFLAVSLARRRLSPVRRSLPVWQTAVAAVLPLLLYLYLPLRARAHPAVNWGWPDSWQEFLVHVTGRQYHGKLGSEGFQGAEVGRFLAEQLPGEAGWLFVLLSVLGLVVLLRGSRSTGLILATTALAYLLYNALYPIHDIRLYYIPVLAIMGIWAAVGAGQVAAFAGRRHALAGPIVAVVLCLACLFPLKNHWHRNDQHDFDLLAHYVHDSLDSVDEGAILLTGRWDSLASPALYYQFVEGYRLDVVVVDVGFMGNPALQDLLKPRAPVLVDACRLPLDTVASNARRAERGMTFDTPAARREFEKLWNCIVDSSLAHYPTYVTSDLFRHPIISRYNLITEGLAARVAHTDSLRRRDMDFLGPGLTQAQCRDASERDVVKEYGVMLFNRAHYLRQHGLEDEAVRLQRRSAEFLR